MAQSELYRNALKPGLKVLWYEIERTLGQGGFGITYVALDTNLHQRVAIKEFLPSELAVREGESEVHPVSTAQSGHFAWGLDKFMDEARTLAHFDHPNIVKVYTVFEANNTAYMVMRYEEGMSLGSIYSKRKRLAERLLQHLVHPLLDGLETVHDQGFIHRDIKPDNIYLRQDASPVLLDFGSARIAVGSETRALTTLVSPGYAPFEQYVPGSDKQGPWSDIYSLGATLYRGICGVPLQDATNRSEALSYTGKDVFVNAREVGRGKYSDSFLRAVDASLAFRYDERPQTVAEWRAMFRAKKSRRKKRERPEVEEVEAHKVDATEFQNTPPPDAPEEGPLTDEPEMNTGEEAVLVDEIIGDDVAGPDPSPTRGRRLWALLLGLIVAIAVAAIAWIGVNGVPGADAGNAASDSHHPPRAGHVEDRSNAEGAEREPIPDESSAGLAVMPTPSPAETPEPDVVLEQAAATVDDNATGATTLEEVPEEQPEQPAEPVATLEDPGDLGGTVSESDKRADAATAAEPIMMPTTPAIDTDMPAASTADAGPAADTCTAALSQPLIPAMRERKLDANGIRYPVDEIVLRGPAHPPYPELLAEIAPRTEALRAELAAGDTGLRAAALERVASFVTTALREAGELATAIVPMQYIDAGRVNVVALEWRLGQTRLTGVPDAFKADNERIAGTVLGGLAGGSPNAPELKQALLRMILDPGFRGSAFGVLQPGRKLMAFDITLKWQNNKPQIDPARIDPTRLYIYTIAGTGALLPYSQIAGGAIPAAADGVAIDDYHEHVVRHLQPDGAPDHTNSAWACQSNALLAAYRDNWQRLAANDAGAPPSIIR